jgi:hypothetical protein
LPSLGALDIVEATPGLVEGVMKATHNDENIEDSSVTKNIHV